MIKIAVHNGSFHADDCFACALLNLLHDQVQIFRTRDKKIIEEADFVVDVGFTYDHKRRTYDHHHGDFQEYRSSGIKLSSFGLLFRHYGKDLIKEILKPEKELITLIFNRLEQQLVVPIDAVDNGINIFELKEKYKKFLFKKLEMDDIIKSFSPGPGQEGQLDQCFFKAVDFSKTILKNFLYQSYYFANNRKIFIQSILKSYKEKKCFIELPQCIPYQEYFFNLQKEDLQTNNFDDFKNFADKLLYVIYPKKESQEINWRLESIPVEFNSFEVRKALPKSWGGAPRPRIRKDSRDKGSVVLSQGPFPFKC